MRIANNIMAMNTHRFYTNNNNAVSKSAEKLSSGYKINRAGDDAAGLAISEKMRSQIRGMNMAKKNSQDAISLVQTAEGALQEVHSMLQRMSELAIQSATGTNEEKIDRAALQQEFQNLQDEINQVASTTTFNDMNLLDGSLSKGGGAGATATAKMGNALTAGADSGKKLAAVDFSGMTDEAIQNAITAIKDIKAGDDQAITFAKGAKANTVEMKVGDTVIATADTSALTDMNSASEEKELEFKSVAGDGTASIGKVKFADDGGDGKATADDMITQLTGTTGTVSVTAAGAAKPAEATKASATIDLTKQTLTVGNGKDFEIDLGGGVKLTYNNGTGGDVTDAKDIADGLAASATGGKVTINEVDYNVTADNGVLKIEAAEAGAPEEGKGADFSAIAVTNDGADVTLADGVLTTVDGADAGAGAMGGLQIQVGPKSENILAIGVDDMSCASLKIDTLDISTQATANAAINQVYTAINAVSTQRAELGALQNRLDHKISNLANTAENLSAAESRIRDVDIAEEMTNFTKNNILSQAATAMLAQANSLPQNVLSLLR